MSLANINLPEEATSRRGFLKRAIALFNGLVALAITIPGLGYLLTPIFRKGVDTWVRLGSLNKFPSGDPQKEVFTYTTASAYTQKEKKSFVWVLLNPTVEQNVTVFSAVCTHTGCNVAWQPDVQKFICPCHGGTYNIKGEVIAGPPPRPLEKLPVRVENDQILVRIPT